MRFLNIRAPMKNNRVGRPVSCRSVADLPKVTCFGPQGIPESDLQSIMLTVDELEAIRLADKEGLYQADAALQMNVSRQTFGRILECARKKVAEAIVDGKRICIGGGVVRQGCDTIADGRPDICFCIECGLEVPHVRGNPCRQNNCPRCGSPLKRKMGCQDDINQ